MRLWIAATLAVLSLAACGTETMAAADTPVRPDASPIPEPPPKPSPKPVLVTYPAEGHKVWAIASAETGPPLGHAGRVMRYRVAVEKDIKGIPPNDFAKAVATTLTDPHGWTAGGRWRFLRVGPGQRSDFTVYLATPDTRDELCDDNPDGYTSCRNGASVVLNVARWVKGVPEYAAAGLSAYRSYMVNHEVGHRLGNGHQLCPGHGDLAPVMQQQTLGLHGCRPNPWPYPDGHLYSGRSGQYGDHPPAPDRGKLS